ncbi:hypothetical protein C8R43DRAFT_1120673 [Mycena crocata]|nr:hypothetical protein C8R43DRAFT_1120673 [Mycena crocata]
MFCSGVRAWLSVTLFSCHIPFLFVRARLYHRHTFFTNRDALSDLSDTGLASASWIWASGASSGNVAFLKTYASADGKSAASATIAITAVSQYTLWVNGQPIGASSDWKSAQVFNAALNTSFNTFSVLAGNTASAGAIPAGLLAALMVHYTDGSKEIVISDLTWVAATAIPADFPLPADTSGPFKPASQLSRLGSGAWGNSVSVSYPDPNTPSLTGGMWIWSTSDGQNGAPQGTIGFRKTVSTPKGQTAQSATVVLTADTTFSLYVNGKFIGAPPHQTDAAAADAAWGHAQLFTFRLSAASNVFAVIIQHSNHPDGSPAPAGLVAAIRIQYADGSSDTVRTDPSWLHGSVTDVSAFVTAPDSALATSFNVADVGAAPWGQLSGTSNVLAAAAVPSSPFTGDPAPTPAPVPAPAPGTNDGGTTSPGGSGTAAGASKSSTAAQSTGSAPAKSGTSGTMTGSTLTSAGQSRSGDDSPTETVTVHNSGSRSRMAKTSTSPPTSGPTGAHSGRSPGVPIGAIVGPLSALALIMIGLAVLRWRRWHQRLSPASIIVPFASGPTESNSGNTPQGSSTSTRGAEMAEQPPPTDVAQRVVPPTKLRRVNLLLQSTATATSRCAASIPISGELAATHSSSPPEQSPAAQGENNASHPPNDDADAHLPPSYSAQ